jgi:hypothetical protein
MKVARWFREALSRGSRGLSLAELIIAAGIVGLVALLISPLLNITRRGQVSLEVETALSVGAQEALDSIELRLVSSKRLFDRIDEDHEFLKKIQWDGAPYPLGTAVGGVPGGLPTLMGASRLSSIVSEESSPTDAVSSTENEDSVGNSLFFASLEAPVHVVLGPSLTVRVNSYRFDYYYLAARPDETLGGLPARELWEWHSIPYVDYNEINNIVDLSRKKAIVVGLYARGIFYAWDASATRVSSAFYTLSPGGGFSGPTAKPVIRYGSANKMIKVQADQSSPGAFRFSVAPNTGPGFASQHPVPAQGVASGNFPSGFEVTIGGPANARRVFVRLVLATPDRGRKHTSFEQTLLVATRDLW